MKKTKKKDSLRTQTDFRVTKRSTQKPYFYTDMDSTIKRQKKKLSVV